MVFRTERNNRLKKSASTSTASIYHLHTVSSGTLSVHNTGNRTMYNGDLFQNKIHDQYGRCFAYNSDPNVSRFWQLNSTEDRAYQCLHPLPCQYYIFMIYCGDSLLSFVYVHSFNVLNFKWSMLTPCNLIPLDQDMNEYHPAFRILLVMQVFLNNLWLGCHATT